MKKYAIVVAGGIGTRMQSTLPKQFIKIDQKPLLYYTLNAFLSVFSDIELILVLPKNHRAFESVIQNYFPTRPLKFVVGGATRFYSVKNGLSLVEPKGKSIIFVHDGVRCLVSKSLIKRCYAEALHYGSAIPAIEVADTIRKVQKDTIQLIDRSLLWAIQTPQTFLSTLLLPAFEQSYSPAFTDEAAVVETFGHNIHLCKGEVSNMKVTHPIDLQLATLLLKEKGLITP